MKTFVLYQKTELGQVSMFVKYLKAENLRKAKRKIMKMALKKNSYILRERVI